MTSKSQEQRQGVTIQSHREPIIPVFQNPNTSRVQEGDHMRNNIPQNMSIDQSLDHSYKEYSRLFRENIMLNNQLKHILEEKNSLTERYNQLKKANSEQEQKKRRHRRNANQIPRNYTCPFPNCQKGYGSEGSLTQHVKLKHPDFYNSGQYQMNHMGESPIKKEIKEQSPQQ